MFGNPLNFLAYCGGVGLQTSQWDSFQVSASKGIEPKEYKWEVGRSGASRRRAVVHGDCDISCKM